MAEPYLLVAYWNENAPDYDALIRRVIGSIAAINAAVHFTSASGMKIFISTGSDFCNEAKSASCMA